MGDNIRPALYQAVYDGFLANREDMIQSRKSQWLVNIANQEMSYFEIFYCQKLKQGIYWPLVVRGLTVIQWQVITTEILDQRWFCRRWTSKISCSP